MLPNSLATILQAIAHVDQSMAKIRELNRGPSNAVTRRLRKRVVAKLRRTRFEAMRMLQQFGE